MRKTVILSGPQGCGKSLAAAGLSADLGCTHVVDEWTPGQALQPGALHVTNSPVAVAESGGAVVVLFGSVGGSVGLHY